MFQSNLISVLISDGLKFFAAELNFTMSYCLNIINSKIEILVIMRIRFCFIVCFVFDMSFVAFNENNGKLSSASVRCSSDSQVVLEHCCTLLYA